MPWLVALATSALCLLGLELGIRALGAFEAQRTWLGSPLGGAGEEADPEAASPDSAALTKQIHPYLGWVDRPGEAAYSPAVLRTIFGKGPPSRWTLSHTRVNRYGFASPVDDYAALSEHEFVVGIFGGSMAKDLAAIGGERLGAEIAVRRGLEPSSVRVLNFASGGYKQPQQVAVLSQMALLGVPFDLVVNLDGYNEVVAGARDARHGRHPLRPSEAQFGPILELSGQQPSESSLVAAAEVLSARRSARVLQARASGAWWRRSALAEALVGGYGLRLEADALEREAALQAEPARLGAPLPGPSLAGPCQPCWELVAALWQRGSRQLAALAASAGAEYTHVLQPNAYVPDTKPLSDRERAMLYDRGAILPSAVRDGYPILQARGAVLAAEGIAFHDATRVFSERPEDLYRDPCCHVNLRGNELLAEWIAARLQPAL